MLTMTTTTVIFIVHAIWFDHVKFIDYYMEKFDVSTGFAYFIFDNLLVAFIEIYF